MTKKVLRETIKNSFDTCILKGETRVVIEAREVMSLSFQPAGGLGHVSWVDLCFNGGSNCGMLRLEGHAYTRKEMIDIFTNFVWTSFFDYDV